MKTVVKYQSEDGKVWDTEKEAMAADVEYWKMLGQKWLDHQKVQEELNRCRQPYQERGSHQ